MTATIKTTTMKGVREGIEGLVGGVADKGQSRLGGGISTFEYPLLK